MKLSREMCMLQGHPMPNSLHQIKHHCGIEFNFLAFSRETESEVLHIIDISRCVREGTYYKSRINIYSDHKKAFNYSLTKTLSCVQSGTTFQNHFGKNTNCKIICSLQGNAR